MSVNGRRLAQAMIAIQNNSNTRNPAKPATTVSCDARLERSSAITTKNTMLEPAVVTNGCNTISVKVGTGSPCMTDANARVANAANRNTAMTKMTCPATAIHKTIVLPFMSLPQSMSNASIMAFPISGLKTGLPLLGGLALSTNPLGPPDKSVLFAKP